MPKAKKSPNRYSAIIEKIFRDRYRNGDSNIEFEREDLVLAARELRIKLPNNLADVLYSFRYRSNLPAIFSRSQPKGMEWIISGAGKSKYRFELVALNRIEPNPNQATIKIPESTPEIITAHSLSDEQALLAKVRYNRLIDVFLGIAAYSLQNHLRTSVAGVGQIEIDELYVGVDSRGKQYVIPVQAKRGSDKLGSVQIRQDVAYCTKKFPTLICRPVAAQFLASDVIAMFELVLDKEQVKVFEERHYKLAVAAEISEAELLLYNSRN